jgi:hypothetical protein
MVTARMDFMFNTDDGITIINTIAALKSILGERMGCDVYSSGKIRSNGKKHTLTMFIQTPHSYTRDRFESDLLVLVNSYGGRGDLCLLSYDTRFLRVRGD